MVIGQCMLIIIFVGWCRGSVDLVAVKVTLFGPLPASIEKLPWVPTVRFSRLIQEELVTSFPPGGIKWRCSMGLHVDGRTVIGTAAIIVTIANSCYKVEKKHETNSPWLPSLFVLRAFLQPQVKWLSSDRCLGHVRIPGQQRRVSVRTPFNLRHRAVLVARLQANRPSSTTVTIAAAAAITTILLHRPLIILSVIRRDTEVLLVPALRLRRLLANMSSTYTSTGTKPSASK